MTRDYTAALKAEAEQHGAEDIEVVVGKHKRLLFTLNGQRRFYVYPSSPSDGARGLQNSLAELRRVMGVKREVRKSDLAKVYKPKAAERIEDFPKLTIKDNPFEKLPELLDPCRPYLERLEKRTELALYRLSFFPGSFREWKRTQG